MMEGTHRVGGSVLSAVVFALALAVAQPAVAQQGDAQGAQKSESLRQKLEFALSAYHGAPTRAQLDELGSPKTVARLLRDVAGDEASRASMRLRAVDVLGHYDDTQTVAFLEAVIDAPSKLEVPSARHAELLRHHAMLSFARIRGDRAVAKLAPLAEGGDLQLRLTAVSALGRFGGKAAHARLRELRRRTDHPALLRTLNKYVTDMSKD